MALISCPECGREKVSDSAVACPDCGFGIREYFEKQRQTTEKENNKSKSETEIIEDNFDMETLLLEMESTLNEFYVRKGAYWYHKDFKIYNLFYGSKLSIEQVSNCSKPYLGEYEFIDYIVDKINIVFQYCENQNKFDIYNIFVSKLITLLSDEKFSDFWYCGTRMYFHSSLHIDKLSSDVIMSIAKLAAKDNYSIWGGGELSILFQYLNENQKQRCISYYGKKYKPELSDTVDITGLYNKWLSYKEKGIKFDTAEIDKYKITPKKIEDTKKDDKPANISSESKVSSNKTESGKIDMPKKPKFSIGSIISILIGFIFIFSSIDNIFIDEYERDFIAKYDTYNPVPYGIVSLIYGILVISTVVFFFSKSAYRYYLAKNNFEKYKKIIIKEQGESDKNKPQMPSKPIFSKAYATGILIGVGIMVVSFSEVYADDGIYKYTMLILGLIIVSVVAYFFLKSVDRYNLAQNDYEAYEKMVRQERANAARNYQAQVEAEKRRLAQTPKCPVCGSKNIKNISTMNRAVSVAAFGLASSKIGKQYECRNCNHKF